MLRHGIAVIVAIVTIAITAPLGLATDGLSGSYSTTISKPASIKGVWTIQFSSGHTKVSLDGHAGKGGSYTISGSTITFKPKGICKSAGKYSFLLSGRTLKFTEISDPCPSTRPAILSHLFTKV